LLESETADTQKFEEDSDDMNIMKMLKKRVMVMKKKLGVRKLNQAGLLKLPRGLMR